MLRPFSTLLMPGLPSIDDHEAGADRMVIDRRAVRGLADRLDARAVGARDAGVGDDRPDVLAGLAWPALVAFSSATGRTLRVGGALGSPGAGVGV